jgi:APA family basic amino acid/polyamine antiporter
MITGAFVGVLAGFLPLRVLAELVNIGTLFAFVVVCTAVLIMRRKHPEAERPFRAPLFPVIPILGIITCSILMFSLPLENWYRLFGWLAIGMIIYMFYGRKHSVMHKLIAKDKTKIY